MRTLTFLLLIAMVVTIQVEARNRRSENTEAESPEDAIEQSNADSSGEDNNNAVEQSSAESSGEEDNNTIEHSSADSSENGDQKAIKQSSNEITEDDDGIFNKDTLVIEDGKLKLCKCFDIQLNDLVGHVRSKLIQKDYVCKNTKAGSSNSDNEDSD